MQNLTFLQEPTQRLAVLPALEIDSGTIIGIVGETGSGKTTLLKSICGLHNPHSGSSIKVFGLSPAEACRQGLVSYSAQQPALMPWLNVYDNVMLPLRLREIPLDQYAESCAKAMLCRLQLNRAKGLFPEMLSSGMASRVAVAQAVISGADLLLLDEVFGTLDEATRTDLDGMLRSLLKVDPDKTALFVTHSVEEAVSLSDRVLVISNSLTSPNLIFADISIDLTDGERNIRSRAFAEATL